MKRNWSKYIQKQIEFHTDTIRSYTRSGDYDDVEMLLASILLEIGQTEVGFDGDVVATDSQGKEFEIYWEHIKETGSLTVKLDPFLVTDQDNIADFNRAMKIV